MTLIYFILVLGITILIHEFGHFLFAKKFGVHCYEFSIGMGPRLFKWRRKNDETEYSIRLFPIGGYVSMAGESTDYDKDVPKSKHLQHKSKFQRFMIMFAGVFFNYILAIICFTIVGLVSGSPTNVPYVAEVSQGYPAYEVGMNTNAEIIKINGKKIRNMDHLTLELASLEGETIAITLLTEAGQEKIYNLTPKKEEIDGETVYRYGFSIATEVKEGFFNAIKYGFTKLFHLFEQMIMIIAYLITGKLSLSSLAGPIGIYNLVGESAKAGLINLVYLVGYLCVNVGVINIIPLPAFDGGHILFIIIEAIKGKPISPKVENTIHAVGMIFLLLLMLVVTINDIIRLF
ncbi:MAG: RIP metalloprotease RseP [Bacilli bacterium]|nr:RIP metalloprotease RseP [Bacilli bacterium]